MILVIGTENCSRCSMVKTVLDNKGTKYEYKLLSSFSQEEQDNYINMAKESGLISFPLIVKDENIISLQEVS